MPPDAALVFSPDSTPTRIRNILAMYATFISPAK
jgi:hypothetical protein